MASIYDLRHNRCTLFQCKTETNNLHIYSLMNTEVGSVLGAVADVRQFVHVEYRSRCCVGGSTRLVTNPVGPLLG